MATGTLSPEPYHTVLDASGNPVAGAKVWTYVAGTSTPVVTYTDVGLLVPNTNPIIADSAGRWYAYLSPGASIKLVIQDSGGGSIRTQDNVAAIPTASNNVDVVGVAGEPLTAGQTVYLSDGSGGRTPGQWYKGDSANTYSSTLPEVGIVPASIPSGQSGTVRITGVVPGLSSLVVGAEYFVGSSGAMTVTAPFPNRRHVGHADTTSTLVLTANPGPGPAPILSLDNNFRLTLASGAPAYWADVTGSTLYLTPYNGNRIAISNGAGVITVLTSAEISAPIPAVANTMYDVFVWNNAGVPALEFVAWTNDSTRATGIFRWVNGQFIKATDGSRVYLGSLRTSGAGISEDTAAHRWVWNYYNRTRCTLLRNETVGSWAQTTNGFRFANNNTLNNVSVVHGVNGESVIDLTCIGIAAGSGGPAFTALGIGEGSAAVSGYGIGSALIQVPVTTPMYQHMARLQRTVDYVGYNYYSWLEWQNGPPNTTWYAADPSTGVKAGLIGTWER